LFQIYRDWANHYLEKGKVKRRISDLQTDAADGLLLADLIECIREYELWNDNALLQFTKTA
jgi:hypothetical protein